MVTPGLLTVSVGDRLLQNEANHQQDLLAVWVFTFPVCIGRSYLTENASFLSSLHFVHQETLTSLTTALVDDTTQNTPQKLVQNSAALKFSFTFLF